MTKQETKEKIVDTAIDLFNAKGSTKTSTRHIADAMGISVGNLYYYFKNKEEIIRRIFERMIVDYDGAMKVEVIEGKLIDYEKLFTMVFSYHWKYRFFKKEFISLFHKDKVLGGMYRAVQGQKIREIEMLIRSQIELGMTQELDEKTLKALVHNSWILSSYWVTFLEIAGDMNEQRLQEGIEAMMYLIKPYLTDRAVEILVERKTRGFV